MMGKTHIFIGTAAALALTFPENAMEILAAAGGGAVGGMISDVDLDSLKNIKDTLHTKKIAASILAVSFLLDFVFKCGMVEYMKNANPIITLIGVVSFVALYFIGAAAKHRGFTHSLLAMLIYSASFGAICYPLAFPFMIGFASHLVLDMLNKKPIKLFFPLKKGVCLKLCPASGKLNKAFMYVGIVLSVIFIGIDSFRVFVK